jgi:predicted DNA-binding protein
MEVKSQMEIKFEVPDEVWQKFERLSGDIGKDRNQVFTEIVEKAYADLQKAKANKLNLPKSL